MPSAESGILRQIRDGLRYAYGDRLYLIRQHQTLGSQPGVPDLVGCINVMGEGRFVAIEVKTPRGRVSPSQAAALQAIQRAGGIAMVARSLEEVLDRLTKEGIPPRPRKEGA